MSGIIPLVDAHKTKWKRASCLASGTPNFPSSDPNAAQVKGASPTWSPLSGFNDVALHDCQTRRIGRPYRDAQDRLLWKDKTCPARTYRLAHHELESVVIIISVNVAQH